MRFAFGPAIAAAVLATALATPAAAQDYYETVRPVIQENCLRCHSEHGVAWSMEDPERTFMRRRAIGAAILTRKMPPWLAAGGHQEYVDDMSLSEETLERVRAWVDAGHPKGEPTGAEPAFEAPATFEADLELDILSGVAYLPDQENTDDYRCFVVDWPETEDTYVTGFKTTPGNHGVAHHTVVYAIDPSMADRYREFDQEEEGAGYQCFGGAQPDRLSQRAVRDAFEAKYPGELQQLYRSDFWLAHWAPGMDGYEFPENTGVRMQPGSVLVVQMHYYSAHAPGESDAGSMMGFQLASEVEQPAIHYPLTGDWFNGELVVPPGEMATYETSANLVNLVPYLARLTNVPEDSIQGLELYSANLHMHSYGHSGVITLTDELGRKETLLSVPKWDLDWQRDFTFTEPKQIRLVERGGARLTVTCTFENPTDEPVYGGLGSDEEMCFNFSYIAIKKGTKAAEADATPRRER